MIPKKIHQIWLGPFDPPFKWTKTWSKFCEKYGWDYKLWREDDLDLVNQKQFDDAKSYQEKADIARYEIILKHGGLYIDCDMVWLGKNLEKYLPFHSSSFIGVQEYPSVSKLLIGYPYLSNGFFAAPPNHYILANCVKEIPDRVNIKTSHVFIKTGPVLLNKNIKNDNITILPYHYVFPLDFHYKTNITNPMIFSKNSIVFTYNGGEYEHLIKLKELERKRYRRLNNK